MSSFFKDSAEVTSGCVQSMIVWNSSCSFLSLLLFVGENLLQRLINDSIGPVLAEVKDVFPTEFAHFYSRNY